MTLERLLRQICLNEKDHKPVKHLWRQVYQLRAKQLKQERARERDLRRQALPLFEGVPV